LLLQNHFDSPYFHEVGYSFISSRNTAFNYYIQNITITLEHELDIELILPSSTEVYSILLAAPLLQLSNMTEVIFTDYVKATKILDWAALRNMDRNANLASHIRNHCK